MTGTSDFNDERDFFVSYNKADKQWAKWITAVLEQNGWSCFLQAWDFRPGHNFVVEMQNALKKSKRFIAVLSPSYEDAPYCQSELAAVYQKDPASKNRLLIPVRVVDFNPTGLWASIIYIDLVGENEESAEKVLLQGIDTAAIPRKRPMFPNNLGVCISAKEMQANLPTSNSMHGSVTFDYSSNDGLYTIGEGDREFTTKWTKASNTSIHAYNDHSSIDKIARLKSSADIDELPPIESLDFTSRTRTPVVGDSIIWINDCGHIAITKVDAIKDDSRGDTHDELTFSYVIYQ